MKASPDTPLPGRAVRGSKTGHPTMALLDLLGRRWALRILWELNETPSNFRDLQHRCDSMSPSVLNQRISELREAGIVETSLDGYRLTAEGSDLLRLLAPLSRWSKRWAGRFSEAGPDVGEAT
jgi:DNA-binding HxlR family transcriptional regulator